MINLYDILTISNQDYVIGKMIEYNDNMYYLLIEVDKDENLKENQIIAKEVVTNGETGLVKIVDEDEYNNVKDIFVDLLFQ